MPISPSRFPLYLVSGAATRAHHAFLAKLHEARSSEAEEIIIMKEIERIEGVITGQAINTDRTTECLIILLHCFMIGSRKVLEKVKEDRSLMSALTVAESGSSLKERRIGYLYLMEVMPRDHKFHLMLINTIRKDLTSSKPNDILLALNAIIEHPTSELKPAVEPLLLTKSYLRHKLPSIRRCTIQALVSLHPVSELPISRAQLIKLMKKEDDPSVLSHYSRVLQHTYSYPSMLEQGTKDGTSGDIVQLICDKSPGLGREGLRSALSCLDIVVRGQDRLHIDAIERYVADLLHQTSASISTMKALLPDICSFHTTHLSHSPSLRDSILKSLEEFVSPSSTLASSSTSTDPAYVSSNDHVLLLRCLAIIPKETWESSLSETIMGIVMGGSDSLDPLIRKMTIKILHDLCPNLMDLSVSQNLQSLRSNTNLVLPIHVPKTTSEEGKIELGIKETAGRVLEVLELTLAGDGEKYGRGVGELLDLLICEQVWEDGLKRIFSFIGGRSIEFRDAFSRALLRWNTLRTGTSNNTLLALQGTLASEYSESLEVLENLIRGISSSLPSVQELILFACIGILGRMRGNDRDEGIDTLRGALRETIGIPNTSRWVVRRCSILLRILDDNQFDQVWRVAKSSTIPDILDAVIHVDSTIILDNRATSTKPGRSTSSSPSKTTDLKYEPYNTPALSYNSIHSSRRTLQSPARVEEQKRGSLVYDGMSAGEFALIGGEGEGQEVCHSLCCRVDDTKDENEVPLDVLGLTLRER